MTGLGKTTVAQTTSTERFSVQATFVLLYAAADPGGLIADTLVPPGLETSEPDLAVERIVRIQETERRMLGDRYRRAQRVSRRVVGRLPLGDVIEGELVADVYRVTHISGAAAWEVWLTAPTQPLSVSEWIARLSFTTEGSLAARIWLALAAAPDGPEGGQSEAPELYLPFSILRVPDHDLATILAQMGTDLVRLVHLDGSREPFKPSFVAHELAQDFCLREGGLSLLSPRSALDLHCGPTALEQAALPLLITLELLALERAALRRFHERLVGERTKRLDELLQLKRDVADGLEEYYGALAVGNVFSAQATALGQSLLGIDDLHRSVLGRLDTVTFGITTRLEQRTNRVSLWLAILFGAIGTGFLAEAIATWYYHDANALGSVIAWAAAGTLATALVISLLFRIMTRE